MVLQWVSMSSTKDELILFFQLIKTLIDKKTKEEDLVALNSSLWVNGYLHKLFSSLEKHYEDIVLLNKTPLSPYLDRNPRFNLLLPYVEISFDTFGQYMNETDRKTYDDLPQTVKIYRGTRKDEHLDGLLGMSWTLNYDIADSFANEFYKRVRHAGVILEVEVDKSVLVAYTNEKNEEECIISPQLINLNKVNVITTNTNTKIA